MPLKLDIEFIDDAEFVRSLPLVTLAAGVAEKLPKSCEAGAGKPCKPPVGVGTEGSLNPPVRLFVVLLSTWLKEFERGVEDAIVGSGVSSTVANESKADMPSGLGGGTLSCCVCTGNPFCAEGADI